MTTNKLYLGFTVGPILRTITRARKTRDLWASSYIFSLLMRKILDELRAYKKLMPYDPAEETESRLNGTGLWPDRCMIELDQGQMPDMQKLLDEVFKALAKDLNLKNAETLKPLFRIGIVKADWTEVSPKQDAVSDDSDVMHCLYHLLDNLELAAHYQPKEDLNLNFLLQERIHRLYEVARHQSSALFIHLPDGSVRLPSLPEIALKEIKEHPDFRTLYLSCVEQPGNEKIMALRDQKGQRFKDFDFDSEQDNERLYISLKNVLPEGTLALRHKYIAVVAADGDGVGTAMVESSKKGELGNFSKSLMAFAEKAVEKIITYGGLPVYAGGDDLLFIAPLTNQGTKLKNIINLCDELNNTFQQEVSADSSLSFGVSVTYYKFPLGEAVQEAYHLEKKAKKFKIWELIKDDQGHEVQKLLHAKQALSFQVRKHSGQKFGATFGLNGESARHFMDVFLGASMEVDETFLSSVMHNLQKLPFLVASAAQQGTLEHFRANHFNEGGKHDKVFMKEAMTLLEKIFEDYGAILDPQMAKHFEKDPAFREAGIELFDLYRVNVFYALLRFKQFLIQKDHD